MSMIKSGAEFCAGFLLALTLSKQADAGQHFNPLALQNDSTNKDVIDLSAFDNGGQPAGRYRVDVYLNDSKVATQNIVFHASASQTLQPCLSAGQLRAWGIKATSSGARAACQDLSLLSATAAFDFSRSRLDLRVPQRFLQNKPRDEVPEALWDEGITAFLLNYSLSGSQQQGESRQYANLRPGLNLGPWRLRNYTTWDNGDRWRSVYSYAWRDLKALRGRLVLGDASSDADVFEAVAFRGLRVSSDEEMQPDSLRGFSPTIRGIARSNAQVSVKQNGYLIYRTDVPAGPFEIRDLYATGSAGDLAVTIKESDGSEQHLLVPYASVPVLQREGHLKYSLTVGRTRQEQDHEENIAELTALYGLPGGVTVYGGLQTTPGSAAYRALQLGSGLNLGSLGALSLDVTDARSQPETKPYARGQAWRVRYSKSIEATETQLSLTGSRYISGGYYTLQDLLEAESEEEATARLRSQLDLTLAQSTAYGSLSLNLFQETYRDAPRTLSLGVGYNNVWHEISYGLSYTWTVNTDPGASPLAGGRPDHQQQFSLTLSLPLSRFLPSAYATYTLNAARPGETSQMLGLNGTALAQNNLSWSVQQGYTAQKRAVSGSLNAALKSRLADLNAGYSYDAHQQRLSYGLQGGLLLHQDGVTLSQPLNETVVLIKAPGAADVPIENSVGVSTDVRGYAVIPYASPWHRNEISLGERRQSDSTIELLENSRTVIPTRGAVVRAEYKTNIGAKALVVLTRSNHAPVPFGATVSQLSAPERHPGLTGDQGQVWLTGLQQQGILVARWGPGSDQRCRAQYQLPTEHVRRGVAVLPLRCL
ncbi:MAG: fimbria/pilus outer membrane usher protein [Scandinavium sp.]|uniref:fimbria/pilus outer membrane usher protein n=1 Tax=Scandinavium sp. TaxID=2830653 RepID=UPI003F3C142D